MLKFKKLEIENFLSIGNVKQIINFKNEGNLHLIIGENLDDISSGISRNGVGKTTLLQALYYAIYGISINNNIKKDNLINKINKKNMKVSLEFEKNNVLYRIERGRKPNILNWYINNKIVSDDVNVINDSSRNEAEDNSRNTQKEINKVIKISPNLFKYIVILNTNTESFLSLPFNFQRDLIEDLLGIKEISQKADLLKEKIKITEELIREEEREIYLKIEQNKKIENKIKELEIKRNQWIKENNRELNKIKNDLQKYKYFDSDKELMMFELRDHYFSIEKELKNYNESVELLNEKIKFNEKKIKELMKNEKDILEKIEKIEKDICPVCSKPLEDDEHVNSIKKELENVLENNKKTIYLLINETEKLKEEKNDIIKNKISKNQILFE